MREHTVDMMQLDRQLETLSFQIFAYQKSKGLDHQPLMEFNLHAIKTLCTDIYFKLERDSKDE